MNLELTTRRRYYLVRTCFSHSDKFYEEEMCSTILKFKRPFLNFNLKVKYLV